MALNDYAIKYMDANGAGFDEGKEGIENVAAVEDENKGGLTKNADDETFDESYEDGTADETSYLEESGTVKTGDETADETAKDATVAGGETRTSAGDDFSATVLPTPSVRLFTPEELDELRLETTALYEDLMSSLQESGGVFAEDKKKDVLRLRACLTTTFEQCKEPFLKEPQEIAEFFLADYYHVVDFDLSSTRSVARFYEADSIFNFVGIPEVMGRRPISRAIVVSDAHTFQLSVLLSTSSPLFVLSGVNKIWDVYICVYACMYAQKKYSQLRVRHRVRSWAIDESPPNMCMYLLTCKSAITVSLPLRLTASAYYKALRHGRLISLCPYMCDMAVSFLCVHI